MLTSTQFEYLCCSHVVFDTQLDICWGAQNGDIFTLTLGHL